VIFIDSNIPMYVAGRDHAARGPTKRFLTRVQRGDVETCTSTEVLQEILYRYAGLKRLDLAANVYELFVEICPVVFPVTLPDTNRAKEILCAGNGVSARDALHAAVMLNNDVHAVATFDRDFDSIEGIERVDLA